MADEGKKYDALDRRNAPEIYRLIDRLVKAHHSSDLCDARIGAMYVYDVKPDCDEIVWWAKACLVSGKAQEYEPHDFRIEINFTIWNTLTNDQKRAVMDHELCHCGRLEDEKTGTERYYIRKHDLEEFHDIVARYGPKWRPAVEEFVKRATGQEEPTLFDGVDGAEKVVTSGAARLLSRASDRRTASTGT